LLQAIEMQERVSLSVIKRGTLLFWAAWLSVVATTNLLNGLQALGTLPESFRFVSGNWTWINQVMDPLGVPRLLQATLFAGAIAWEVLGATLFWWAVATYRGRPLTEEKAAVFACGVNLALWAAFQVLDEVFLAYQPEAVHRVIFISQIATLLFLHLLPNAMQQPGIYGTDELRAHSGAGGPGLGSSSK
jgi:hypothetical protein